MNSNKKDQDFQYEFSLDNGVCPFPNCKRSKLMIRGDRARCLKCHTDFKKVNGVWLKIK